MLIEILQQQTDLWADIIVPLVVAGVGMAGLISGIAVTHFFTNRIQRQKERRQWERQQLENLADKIVRTDTEDLKKYYRLLYAEKLPVYEEELRKMADSFTNELAELTAIADTSFDTELDTLFNKWLDLHKERASQTDLKHARYALLARIKKLVKKTYQ